MKPEEVAQFLQDHPQFFNDHAYLLSDITVPHPHDDRVVSINERQIISLRERNRILQDKLLELISFGEENDTISERMHRLSIALLSVSSIRELLNTLDFSLRQDFSIPHFALRIWNISCKNMTYIEFSTTSLDIHTIAESLTQPYCGNHVADEIKSWFGEDAGLLNSFSMIPLKTTQTIGLLVLASPDSKRFYPEMGTLHLKRLGDLISTTLARHDLSIAPNVTEIDNQLANEQQT